MTQPNAMGPSGQDHDIQPADLILDPGNLRLLEYVETEILESSAGDIGASSIQALVLNIFQKEKRLKLNNLMASIRSMGFLRNDRLIVAQYNSEKYIVLEGNRRVAAVKTLLQNTEGISNQVVSSMNTLPVFVLDGEPILDNDELLKLYREQALNHIGIRHLTGIQQWEPASRYEFLAKLIEDHGMSPSQIRDRFGYSTQSVLRDYRAHWLYKAFHSFSMETGRGRSRLTYNTFSEASRSPHIRSWLGWSDATNSFSDTVHLNCFFNYVSKYLGTTQESLLGDDFEEETQFDDSAEAVVRRFRDLLKQEDPQIESALELGDYSKAHELMELRKSGKLEQRLRTYINGIISVSMSEMMDAGPSAVELLEELTTKSNELKLFIKSRQ